MSLADTERRIEEIERGRTELVALASDLIRFDTAARAAVDDPPRDEAALQEYLAGRLRAAGAETELWEPPPEEVTPSKIAPAGLRFDGRPQLVARFPGTGGGRSLLLNGHVDVVSAEPRKRWTSDPNHPQMHWHDGATFTRFGGTPCVCFGPGGNETAHMIDESVPVDDLVACAQALAVAAIRFSG